MDKDLLRTIRDEIDEINYHPCGNTWDWLNELVDSPGVVVGSLAAWVLALDGTPKIDGAHLSDTYSVLAEEHDIDELARRKLGLSHDEWMALEGLELSQLKPAISRLIGDLHDLETCDCDDCYQKPERLSRSWSDSEAASAIWAAVMVALTAVAVGAFVTRVFAEVR